MKSVRNKHGLSRALTRLSSDCVSFADLLRNDNGPFPRSISGFIPIIQDIKSRFLQRLDSLDGAPRKCEEIREVLELADELESNLSPQANATQVNWTIQFLADYVDPILEKLDQIT